VVSGRLVDGVGIGIGIVSWSGLICGFSNFCCGEGEGIAGRRLDIGVDFWVRVFFPDSFLFKARYFWRVSARLITVETAITSRRIRVTRRRFQYGFAQSKLNVNP